MENSNFVSVKVIARTAVISGAEEVKRPEKTFPQLTCTLERKQMRQRYCYLN